MSSRSKGKRKGKGKRRGKTPGSGPKRTGPTAASAGNTAVAEKGTEAGSEAQSWGEWLGSWFASTGEAGATYEVEGDDDAVLPGLGTAQTVEYGEGAKEEELELPTPDLITVNLAKRDFEAKFGDADSKGSVSIDRVLSGYKGKAEFEISSSVDAARELGTVSFGGGMLTGEFSQQLSLGDRFAGKGEGSITGDEISARGELSAFSGYSESTKATFKVNVGGVTIATFSGSAGTTIGSGGKLKGQMSFKGGAISWGGQSVVSSGVGVALEYKVEVDGRAIAGGMWSWASGWASWLWENAGSLGDALLDEDGEPLIL